jgi:hypothetical protein
VNVAAAAIESSSCSSCNCSRRRSSCSSRQGICIAAYALYASSPCCCVLHTC